MPARSKGSRLASLRLRSNQSRKSASCCSSPARGGASKCTVGRSRRPETTCMGSSPRSAPMSSGRAIRLSSSGNNQRCQVVRPSSLTPSRFAREERTEPTFSCSPSIADEVTMFCSMASRLLCASVSLPTAPSMPISRPCAWVQARSSGASGSACQVKRGQSGCCQIQRGSVIDSLICEPISESIRLIT